MLEFIVLYAFLVGLHGLLVVLLSALVLMQPSARNKSVMSGGFAPRGSADLVTYITAALGAMIFISNIMLSRVTNAEVRSSIATAMRAQRPPAQF
jgi:preprotein translocase subunit SecG